MPKVLPGSIVRCSICAHDKRREIEAAYIRSEGIVQIADRFDLTKSAVGRHVTEHLPKSIQQSKALMEKLSAENLSEHLDFIQARTIELLLESHQANDRQSAIKCLRQAAANVELRARLAGLLPRAEAPTVNAMQMTWEQFVSIYDRSHAVKSDPVQ